MTFFEQSNVSLGYSFLFEVSDFIQGMRVFSQCMYILYIICTYFCDALIHRVDSAKENKRSSCLFGKNSEDITSPVITTTKLTAEDGLPELIKILEKLLGKDDLEDCMIKYDDFEDY